MDPTFELIKEIIAVLKNDTALVTALGGPKIYDRVPEKQDGTPNVDSPYISFGSSNFSTEDYDCVDAVDISIQVNVYSFGENEAYSSAECRKLSFMVRKLLHKAEINLSTNGFVELQNTLVTYNRTGDGVTNHGILQFSALVDVI